MAITPEENVAYLEAVLAKAKLGAQATANAMAAHVADRVANDTLQRRRNPPGTWYKARPGDPPSYGTGDAGEEHLHDSRVRGPADVGVRRQPGPAGAAVRVRRVRPEAGRRRDAALEGLRGLVVPQVAAGR